MHAYKKFLLCLDLTDDSEVIAERAKSLAGLCGASLTLLHVVEYVPVEPMGEALLPAVQIEGELVERATVATSPNLRASSTSARPNGWCSPATSSRKSSASPRSAART